MATEILTRAAAAQNSDSGKVVDLAELAQEALSDLTGILESIERFALDGDSDEMGPILRLSRAGLRIAADRANLFDCAAERAAA
ncbi:MAG: hypothetical protein V5B38_11765 [Candidatus Accumulibacter propinquus]|jgi:hypothetical protein